jgi:hypothetical protein
VKQLGEQRSSRDEGGTFEFYDKKEGTERQPSRIWRVRIIVALEFTLSEKIRANRGHPLFGQVREVNSDPYARVVNRRSSNTTEQPRRRYRMRDRRSWTMRQQPVRMPVPRFASACAIEGCSLLIAIWPTASRRIEFSSLKLLLPLSFLKPLDSLPALDEDHGA